MTSYDDDDIEDEVATKHLNAVKSGKTKSFNRKKLIFLNKRVQKLLVKS